MSTDIFAGGVKYLCPFYFKWFTTQGFPNHMRSNERNGDKSVNKKPNGQVKSHGPKYDKPFVGGKDAAANTTTKEDVVVNLTGNVDVVNLTEDTTSTSPVTEDTTSTSPVQEVKQHRLSTGGQRNFTMKVSCVTHHICKVVKIRLKRILSHHRKKY